MPSSEWLTDINVDEMLGGLIRAHLENDTEELLSTSSLKYENNTACRDLGLVKTTPRAEILV